MRRLMILFVVLVMLGLCASLYGYFLIDNISMTIKGVNTDRGTAMTLP
jgi:hypothetical protein